MQKLTAVLCCSLPVVMSSCSCERGTGEPVDTDAGRRDAAIIVNPETGMAEIDAMAIQVEDNCMQGAEWIYLLDRDSTLIQYEPNADGGAGRLTPIATLNCPVDPAADPPSTPFSMAVRRDAHAYVLYQDHAIYDVDTRDGTCVATSYVADQRGLELFGMAFSANEIGGNSETLFVAGGRADTLTATPAAFASLSVPDLQTSLLGMLDESIPELTGTGNAEVWGFFPAADPMVVRKLDRADGHTLSEFDVSAIDVGSPTRRAWAFAFWGGNFYIFYTPNEDTQSAIWKLSPDTGQLTPAMPNTGRRIVGAGVSTCAPTVPS